MSTKPHWEDYYRREWITEPSNFAKRCLPHFSNNSTLIDLGCGSGRDSLFFSKSQLKVVAVDQSLEATSKLARHCNSNIRVYCSKFEAFISRYSEKFDICYLRFVLHAVNKNMQYDILNWCKDNAKTVAIEARSDKGTHDNRHYRRLINMQELKEQLNICGFTHYIFEQESQGLSIVQAEDPVLINILVRK